MKELLDLYLSFFKMGAVTFGGGYTMLRYSSANASKASAGSATSR